MAFDMLFGQKKSSVKNFPIYDKTSTSKVCQRPLKVFSFSPLQGSFDVDWQREHHKSTSSDILNKPLENQSNQKWIKQQANRIEIELICKFPRSDHKFTSVS